MPVHRCPNGSYRIGSGKCIYKTREDAERAYQGYLGSKFSSRRIQGEMQEMSAEDIRSLIDADTYKVIKAGDPHPVFAAFSLGHEGESTGNTLLKSGGKILGSVKLIKRWLKQTVQMMTEKLKIGTKVFHLHTNKDNSHEGRTPIGELVGKGLKKIKDIVHSIGIIYYYPEFAKNNYDIASVEGKMDFSIHKSSNGNIYGDDISVHDITAVTVGNSQINKPGFAGATLQALMQEFAEEAVGPEKTPNKGETMTLSISEVKQFITAEGLNPSDVFEADVLASDPAVRGIVKEEKTNEYFARKRVESENATRLEKLEKENAELKNQIVDAERTATKIKSRDNLGKIISGRKLTEPQRKWVEKDFEKQFKVDDVSKVDDELKSFVDSSLTEFDERAEILGIKKNIAEGEKPGDGAPAPEADDSGSSSVDYTDPKNNPLIPQEN